jgi:hypothetical protein
MDARVRVALLKTASSCWVLGESAWRGEKR